MAFMLDMTPSSYLAEVSTRNPDKMSHRECRNEVKTWRKMMKAKDTVEIGTDIATDMITVKILGKVDGKIPRSKSHDLDAILNNSILEYDEKIKGIQELINAG